MICLDFGLKEVFPQERKNILFLLNLFAKLPRERESCVLYFWWHRMHRETSTMFVGVYLHGMDLISCGFDHVKEKSDERN